MFTGQDLHLGEDVTQVLGVPSRSATARSSWNFLHVKLGLRQYLRDLAVILHPQR